MKAIAKKTYKSPEVVAFNLKIQSYLLSTSLDPSGDTPSVEVSDKVHQGGFSAREYDFDEDEY